MTFRNVAFCFGAVAAVVGLAPADGRDLPAGTPVLDSSTDVPGEIRLQSPAATELRGNPLWTIPITSLSATRERPVFLPSRRPPAPAVAAPLPVEPAKPPPPPVAERPHLALVGSVVGEIESVAVFMDSSTRATVRLKMGETHAGWILRSVKGREAVLQKGGETVTLAFPALSDPQTMSLPSPYSQTGVMPGLLPGLASPAGGAKVLPPPSPLTTSGGSLPSSAPFPTPGGRLPGL